MRVAVIGAGPAGITAAFELARRGVQVVVYESGDQVGGMARSFDLWGQRVDVGPHRFFTRDERVRRLWLGAVGADHCFIRRRTRILFADGMVDYPLRPIDALTAVGPLEASRCVASYALTMARGQRGALRPDGEESFQSLMERRFGKRLFELFFRSYTEKVWGLPCDRLSADFAVQRIRDFSLGAAIRGAVSARARRHHATTIDGFLYPRNGAGEVFARLARGVVAHGGAVRLRARVAGLAVAGRRIVGVRLEDGSIEDCDHVISTMPLPTLVRSLPSASADLVAAAGRLRFRHTAIVYLQVASTALFDDQWLYVHSPEVGVGRVTNFRNWAPEMHRGLPFSILAAEYWHDDGDSLASIAAAPLIDRAQRELRAVGILGAEPVLGGTLLRVPRCYPVYELGYRHVVDSISRELAEVEGLTVIGRAGAFNYGNQDHSMLMGLQAADNVFGHSRHDVWQINADPSAAHEPDVVGSAI